MFAFAGLWDQWQVDEGITLLSCTILTTAAQGPIKHLHHRMPVRLPKEQWNNWLDWDSKADFVLEKMRGGDDLDYYDVDNEVSSGRAKGAHLIKPAGIKDPRDEPCLLYTSPSPRDRQKSRMPSSA